MQKMEGVGLTINGVGGADILEVLAKGLCR